MGVGYAVVILYTDFAKRFASTGKATDCNG
jgi:hypothetical protein